MGVVMPLILAPKATASKTLVRKILLSVIDIATGSSNRATVEFDNAVPSATEATPRRI